MGIGTAPIFSQHHCTVCLRARLGMLPANSARDQLRASDGLDRISHQLTVEARDRPAITSLRLLVVLNVLFKYASARRVARALY